MPILIKTHEEEHFCWDKGYFMSAELGSSVNRPVTPQTKSLPEKLTVC